MPFRCNNHISYKLHHDTSMHQQILKNTKCTNTRQCTEHIYMQLFKQSISNILSKPLITYSYNINVIHTTIYAMTLWLPVCKLYNLTAKQQQCSQPIQTWLLLTVGHVHKLCTKITLIIQATTQMLEVVLSVFKGQTDKMHNLAVLTFTLMICDITQ